MDADTSGAGGMHQSKESGTDRSRLVRTGCDCIECDIGDCSCVVGGSGRCLCDQCRCGRDESIERRQHAYSG